MDYMHSNGFSYTQEEIEEAAKKKGISIEDYLVETPELSMEGKQNGLAEDSTPSPENTELKLEAGGSEQEEPDLYNTGWGDKLYNGLRDSWLGKSVRAGSLNSANDGLTKEEGLARVKKEVEDERKADEVRRSDDAWTSQSTDFSRNLDDMFNDPEMFQKILGDEETLQNRNAEGGGGLNSAEHLKGIIKDQIGGMGWFDDRKVDPTTGQPVYSRLTNSDMDALISEKFEAKLYEEQTNVSNGRGTAKNLARQKDGISLEEYWSEDSNTTISSFTGNDKKLAELYKDIKSGSLNEVDMIKKSKQFKELRAKEGKHHMVLDPKTGMLRVASDDKHRDKLLEDGHIPLDINGKQKEYENITDYDVLKQEYQRSALSLGGLNDELKTMRTAEVDNPAYTSVAGRDKDLVRSIYEKKISVTKSTKDWLQDTHTGVVMEKVRLQEDVVDYNSDHEALKRMYFLNEGIKDQDIGAMGHLATSAKSFIEPFIGEYNTDQLMGGQTDRVILDKVGEKFNQLGFEVTKEDEEYLERGVGEMVNEGLFGSARILAEFYSVNKIAKPLQAITGLTKYMNTLQGGRWVKNGKTFTDANIKARATARGMAPKEYIKSLGGRVKGWDGAGKLSGMRFTTNSVRDRGVATLITGGIEGAKFSAIEAFDEGDVSVKGFATGFGFGVGGRILAPLAPYMQKNGLLKDFDKKLGKIKGKQRSVNVNTRKLFETFITQPASFVAGSEFGEVMSAVTQDAMGNKQFSDFMDEHYGDYGEVGKRLITNGFIGLGFGMTHFKGFGDYKSKAGLRNSFKKSKKLMQQIAVEKGGVTQLEINRSKQGFFDPEIQAKIEKNLSDKNLKEYYKHWEVKDGLQKRYLDAVRAEGYMDPSRANEIVKREHKQEIKDAKEQGIDIEIEVVNNNRLKFGQEAMINKEGNAFNADVIRKGNKIKYRYNAELYTPDIKAHEMSHDYFEREFGYNAVFKGDFFKKLESVGSKIELDKNLSEKEAVELGTPMLAGTTMNLSQAMKLKKFDLTDAVKNQKIQQWELFSYIAERIGDKSNYNNIKGSDGFLGLRNVISEFGKRGGQKYDLTQEKDVVRWFRDYAKNVKKGVNQTKMFKELESVIDADGPLLKKAELAAQGKTGKNKYSSEILELEGGGKVNNPEKLKNEAQEYFKAKGIKLGEGKIEDYRELMGQKERRGDRKMEMDINSPHTDFERYPILGNKLGPMFDIALNLYQRTIPERYRVDANNKSWDGERAELAVASLTDKRGFQDIFRTYDPAKGTLMSHVTGMLKTRMEEIKYRSVDAKYESRRAEAEGSVVSGQDISDIKTDIIDINASGGIAKGGESGKTVAENTGIRLRDYEFNYGGGVKRKINPQSVERLEQASEDVFFETPLNELTFVNVANKMRGKSSPEMDLLFRGGKTDLKTPKKIREAEDGFVDNNGSINYEAMKLFSSPKFYENTNWGKTTFSKYYKNTGVKFKSTELPVEATQETNARTTKWKKLPATETRVQEFVKDLNTGRDADNINKKRNTLKEGIGDPFALQIFRDRILSPEFEAKVEGNSEAKAKLEGLKAELALRKLRGATPEGLKSEVLDSMIEEVRKIDYTRELFPGFGIRALVERNPEYFKELERSGGAEAYFNTMGYELKGVNQKTFTEYFEAQRFLETNPEMKPFVPELGFKNYSDKKFIKTVESFLPEAIRGESKMAEKAWYKDPKAVESFDAFTKEFYRTMSDAEINHPTMRKALAIGMGKQLLNGEYRGKEWADKWYSENKGTGKAPAYIKHVKATSNGPFKRKVNELLDLPKFKGVKNSDKLKRDMALTTQKYLTKKGSTYEQTTDANTKLHAKVYEKLYDFYAKSNNKADALNNIRRLLQMQTNIEGGFAKGLATHDAVSLNKGAKHSEHDFQLFNMNANFMINMLKNSGNKATFLKNQKSLSKIFKQSIIDKSLQKKYDGKEYGGATSYDFKFTTESGKYPWMRSQVTAETTLDLKSGKTYDSLLTDVITGGKSVKELLRRKQELSKANNKKFEEVGLKSEDLTNGEKKMLAKSVDAAIAKGRMKKKKSRGMSTFDFDETAGISDNFVIATKGKETKRIASHEWPVVGDKMVNEGWKMDFSDFNKVTNGRPGPLMQKLKNQIRKYGNKNVFILTARANESAPAIHEYLKSEGAELPLENITGLGNSTGEAKAKWMLEKFAEGYNDMYFVDDAIGNVKAVKDVLSQLDIKSSVQQALMSENLSEGVNNIMEHSLDIGSKKVFSKAEAKVRGKDIKRRRVFMRDSAADLELLIEPLYGKGKKGIENKEWFKEKFVMPFERGTRDYNSARQSAKNDYMNLRKQNKDVVKQISKPVEGTAFTNDMAMRVYLWNKAGYKIPDLAKGTEAKLVEHIQNNPKLQAYAENFARITKQDKGLKEPGENWWGETMAGEVTNINRGVSRKQYLQEWIDVKNEMFTEENLNKMESKLGTEWRENIEDMFDRMETGRTRSLKMDRGSAAMMNYLNGGIGTIMNFNTRSAVLQTISTTNFLNMRENNPIAAAKAMGNVKQFAKDFKYIMNSDMLKQRRDGLAMNVTEAEIASAAASSQNPVQSIISKVLKAGYLPTKMADSFAISFGGATFYRNRIKMYEKQGVKTKEAESKAFLDFQVIAERTQQSSRADLLSKQQTSLIGRFILPFANTPMQMNRAGMKDILDISKGRFEGGRELSEKIGRVSYYMGAQVAIFAGLQSALFAMLLNDEDVSDEKLANTKSMMMNSMADSMLRGFGIQGAILSASKNAIQEFIKQDSKPGFTADYSEVAEKLLNVSPPIGSKFGMLDRAGDKKKWAKIKKNNEFKFELGNPSLEASLMTVQATTNAPVYSPYQNLFNMKHALSDQYETWQRILMASGWTPYSVAVETEDKKKKKSGPIVYPVIR
jgi:hypothetical protein